MRQQLLKKICPITLLIVVFITAISLSIMHVSASGGFADNSEGWANTQNSLHASPTSTYPYNAESGVTVKSVALDVLYGTTKGFGLAQYHGEVPYEQTYDDDDNAVDGFGKKYARPGTTISGENPDGVSAVQYWGFDDSTSFNINGSAKSMSGDKGSAKLGEYEKINDEKIVSLRLYAMAHTTGGFGGAFVQFFSNLLYVLGVGLALLATTILGLIVDAKNIDMEAIMDMLNLKELTKIFTSSFIFDSGASALSPIAVFAIVMFIFAVVATAIKYAKGSDRKTGLKDLLVTAGAGLLIIGMCLSGKIVTLGSSASDLANALMVDAAGVMSGTGHVFVNQINDSKHSNKVVQISEMSLINKTFIDMQICAQFGVSDIDDLNVNKLGDSGGSIANSILMKYSEGGTMESEFDNNLGYYYWFANSSANKKTMANATYPTTDAMAVDDKLEAMITYLQTCYNGADAGTQNNIRKIIGSFAAPNGATGFAALFLLTAILLAMAVCLFKYCLSVMIGKLELFLSILGLTVAGPLILTTNKKLVTTGKAIIGMIPVAFIEITVYSIIFDLIIYLVASLMANNILRLLVVLFLILLLMKLNPVIQEKIKQMINSATRSISPALSDTKRAIKTYTRQKANDIMNNYDRSKRVVGHDKDGNEILEERGGNALSKLMHQGYNTIYNDGMQRESFRKINAQQNEVRDRNKSKSAEEMRRDAEANVENVMGAISKDAASYENEALAAEKDFQDDCYYKNGDDIVFNDENLTDAEKAQLKELKETGAEVSAIVNSSAYKSLMNAKLIYDAENAKHKGEEGYKEYKLDEKDQLELNELIAQVDSKRRSAEQLEVLLKRSVDMRAKDFAFSKVGLDKNTAGNSDEEKLKNAAVLKSQEMHKAQLEKALQSGINTIKDEVNTKTASKIGSSTLTVNKDAVASSAAMQYQMKQLKDGVIVSDARTAKQETTDIVSAIMNHNDSHYKTNEMENAKRNKINANSRHYYGDEVTHELDKEHAATNVDMTKQKIKSDKQHGKDNATATKEEFGRTVTAPTISEQVENMVNSKKSNMLTKKTMDKAKDEEFNNITPPTDNKSSEKSTSTKVATAKTESNQPKKITAAQPMAATSASTAEAKPNLKKSTVADLKKKAADAEKKYDDNDKLIKHDDDKLLKRDEESNKLEKDNASTDTTAKTSKPISITKSPTNSSSKINKETQTTTKTAAEPTSKLGKLFENEEVTDPTVYKASKEDKKGTTSSREQTTAKAIADRDKPKVNDKADLRAAAMAKEQPVDRATDQTTDNTSVEKTERKVDTRSANNMVTKPISTNDTAKTTSTTQSTSGKIASPMPKPTPVAKQPTSVSKLTTEPIGTNTTSTTSQTTYNLKSMANNKANEIVNNNVKPVETTSQSSAANIKPTINIKTNTPQAASQPITQSNVTPIVQPTTQTNSSKIVKPVAQSKVQPVVQNVEQPKTQSTNNTVKPTPVNNKVNSTVQHTSQTVAPKPTQNSKSQNISLNINQNTTLTNNSNNNDNAAQTRQMNKNIADRAQFTNQQSSTKSQNSTPTVTNTQSKPFSTPQQAPTQTASKPSVKLQINRPVSTDVSAQSLREATVTKATTTSTANTAKPTETSSKPATSKSAEPRSTPTKSKAPTVSIEDVTATPKARTLEEYTRDETREYSDRDALKKSDSEDKTGKKGFSLFGKRK